MTDAAKANEYLDLVAVYLGLQDRDTLGDYSRRMALYYFSNEIPAYIAAKQIREVLLEQAQ